PAPALPPADVGEAQKRERLRLALPALPSVRGGEPPEFDQVRLLGVQRQAELLQAPSQFREEAFGIAAVRGPDDEARGPGGIPPQALSDPDGSLATHPALMIQSLVESRSAKGPTDSDRAAPHDLASALRRWGDASTVCISDTPT